jgi:predicted TIM-barrel fold metal-dependent hydrolase
MRKIDVYNHIWPMPFYKRVAELAPNMEDMNKRTRTVPMITDLDVRFRVMDGFGPEYQQILSLASPPLEMLAGEENAPELARIANDGMAEICEKHPDRFPGFIAAAPVQDAGALMEESERTVQKLGAVGVQVFTNAGGKAMDGPEYRPFYKLMADLDRMIWVHPSRSARFADYQDEDRSQYEIWWAFGWPYETSVFMARLVFTKTFDEIPNLKIITHHGGGMIPFFEGRIGPGFDQLGNRTSGSNYKELLKELKKRPLDYFRMFYADTATFGSKPATECALSFFGAEHMLFASDAPFDPEQGPMYIRDTIKVVDALDISEADRAKIYHGNAIELLKLKN